ncbi:DNA helicase RecQ [Methanimicrococcus blatticola]|uniref:DNA 3'-5' helicase n=1 Tax=Methanimicrococcus blatticola TaxID=91560 RepID=A0A484F682_9EURY|nr:DNA helicase RecQ [Methanimicrococcus blatticola]MBZ3935810.1 DNA helicase RecQ [Methanimicrococcus blatticola]MCC2508070.1 DNA helicase RecQ [Methanimicrococcus blatticola]TDQ68850.1 ATP-dependent DNA helicase RecQ [Methanimicrococcus blatticola]
MAASNKEMINVLERNFGYTAFRPNQEEVIEALLNDRDVFVLMPTGGGKSLCYQIPALMKEGTAVVVSPLISLMKDQVDSLVSNGISAAFLNSTLSESESADVKSRLLSGDLKVLYVAPERLMMSSMLSLLKRAKISLFAIDEAHCVSEWGHDFRPEYRKLSELREKFPNVCIAALTATATERVRRDIVHVLRLQDPVIKISSFNRPNLSYQIVEKKDVMEQLEGYIKKNRNKSGIIYCQSRDSVERLATRLNKLGFSALPYHAGLSDDKRARHQDKFIRDDVDIIVATVAFGMGIDKPDVRFVIHYDLPKNLESYYQETGRGGRDGLECECILFFSRGDWHKIRFLIEKKPSKKERDLAFQQLSQIISYCESTDCRRNVLLRYFGEDIKEPCNNCDSCFHPRTKVDNTAEAQLLLECVNQTGQRFGMSHVVDVLYGARTQKVKDMRHDKLSIHGAGKHISKNEWKRIGNELMQSGYLSVGGDKYPIVKLNPNSRKIMSGELTVELTEAPISRISKGRTVLPDNAAADTSQSAGIYVDETEDIFEDDFESENEMIGSDDYAENSGGAIVYGGKKSVLADGIDDYVKPVVTVQKTFEPEEPPVLKKEKPKTKTAVSKNIVKGKFDSALFNRLRDLRKRIATDKNLPPYIIFADTSLRQMATDFPTDENAFLKIAGVAEYKLQKYGGLFINEISDYIGEVESPTPISMNSAKKSEAVSAEVAPVENESDIAFSEDDLKKTQSLFSQGLSVSEISEIRGIPVQKIVEHLEKLIAADKIDNLDILIGSQKKEAIAEAIEKLQIEFTEKLMNSVVIEKMNVKCSEEEIRLTKALMLAEMKRKRR